MVDTTLKRLKLHEHNCMTFWKRQNLKETDSLSIYICRHLGITKDCTDVTTVIFQLMRSFPLVTGESNNRFKKNFFFQSPFVCSGNVKLIEDKVEKFLIFHNFIYRENVLWSRSQSMTQFTCFPPSPDNFLLLN